MSTLSNKIRLYHADDHAVVREGIRVLLATEPDFELLGQGSDGEMAERDVLELRPDVAILDLNMPQKTGVQVITAVSRQLPSVQILVLSSYDDDDSLFPAIEAGATGYLLKDTSPTRLIATIREVYKGQTSLQPQHAARLIQRLRKPQNLPLTESPLTAREVEILQHVAKGYSNQEIADQLVVSERTIRTHVSHILDKLHLANRTQAALYALKEGLALLDDIPTEL